MEDYVVVLKNGNNAYTTHLIILDTTPPQVQTKEVTVTSGDSYKAEDFIKTYSDNSNNKDYTVAYTEDGVEAITDVGTAAIPLRVCDLSNNCVEVAGRLVIEAKEEPKKEEPKKEETKKEETKKEQTKKEDSKQNKKE